MTAEITLTLSDEVIDTLKQERELELVLEFGGGKTAAPQKPRGRRAKAAAPRAGSLPARILAWAEARGDKPFRAADIMRRFKVGRAHAAMLLTRLAAGPLPVDRMGRGIYAFRA